MEDLMAIVIHEQLFLPYLFYHGKVERQKFFLNFSFETYHIKLTILTSETYLNTLGKLLRILIH